MYNSEPSEDGAELRVVIDGQQRITTVSLLVLALTDIIDKNDSPSSSQLPQANQLRARYVQEPAGAGAYQPKLRLGEADNATFCALVLQEPLPDDASEQSSTCIDISCGV